MSSVQKRKSALCYDSLTFEMQNCTPLNLGNFIQKFNMNNNELISKSKNDLIKICEASYDGFWKTKILESAKVISFNKFKIDIALEPHLKIHMNAKHKVALSRFRLSNHALMIEKGRYLNIDIN